MKKQPLCIVLIATFLIAGCNDNTPESEPDSFSGLWKLDIILEQDTVTEEWSEWRDGLQGYILYDDRDNMAVHLTSKGYQCTDIRFHDFIDTVSIDELRHRTKSYVYFARYTVLKDERIVVHDRISHSNPNLWNASAKRSYEFRGDTLVLTTVERRPKLRVKWLRY